MHSLAKDWDEFLIRNWRCIPPRRPLVASCCSQLTADLVLPVLPILCHRHSFGKYSSIRGTPPIRLLSRSSLRICVTMLLPAHLHEASTRGCFCSCCQPMATARRYPLVMSSNPSPSRSSRTANANWQGGPVVKLAQENTCSAATPPGEAMTACGRQFHEKVRVWMKLPSASNGLPVTFAKEAAINCSMVLTMGFLLQETYTGHRKHRPQVWTASNTHQSLP